MASFRKTHQVCGTALALGLLVVSTTAAYAAPIQFGITDLGQLTGLGLDNNGNVIDQPMRNIVGQLTATDHPVSYGGGSYIVDGSGDGRLLVWAFGYGSDSHVTHTFVYDPHPPWADGRPTNLLLAGDVGSQSTRGIDMNAKGEVVGSGEWGGVDGKRLFYNAAGSITLQDLATLIPPNSGWKLTDVYSINDRGQILGVGVNPEGQTSGFLLTPAEQVPEPAAWAVFGLAAAAFAWRKRRAA